MSSTEEKKDKEFQALVTACPWLGEDWVAIGEKYKEWEAIKDSTERERATDELIAMLEKYSKTVCEEREKNIDWYHRVAVNRATLKNAHKIVTRVLHKIVESDD